MKKVISTLFVVVGLIIAVPTQAQIKMGIKGGVNLSKATFSNGGMDGKNYTGFFFGPTIDANIPLVGLGVDASLLYSQKGVDSKDASLDAVMQKEIAIPINLKYNIGSSMAGIFFFVGPQFAVNVDKKANDNEHDYSFRSSNMSMNLGLGFKLLKHIQVSGNYNIPLGKTADFGYNDLNVGKLYNCKTKSWQASVAYIF